MRKSSLHHRLCALGSQVKSGQKCKEICESERQTIISPYEVSTSIKRQKAQPSCA